MGPASMSKEEKHCPHLYRFMRQMSLGQFFHCEVYVGSPADCFQMGLVEEMLEDTMEGLEDGDDLEEEVQEEVDKVLWEITAGKSHSCQEGVSQIVKQ